MRFQVQEELTRAKKRSARWFSIYFPEFKDVYRDLKAVSGRIVLEVDPLAGGYPKIGCGRRKPDLERRKAERRRNEEGKDPGIGRGAQRWK